MKTRYKKPSGIPEQFIEATRQGWVDSRTGEVLEAIPNLIARLADYEKYMADLAAIHAESDVDDIAPYGVSSFEMHNQTSTSLKMQAQQEYTAHEEGNTESTTDSVKDITSNKEDGAKSKPRGRGRSKANSADTAVGSTIVVR